MATTLKGIDEVMKNLETEIKNIENRTLKGLILSAILVRRDMEDVAPKIPIDKGNLRASFFVTTYRGQEKVDVNSGKFTGEQATILGSDHQSLIATSQSYLSKKQYPELILGFSANYAAIVHENVDANFAGNPNKGKKGSRRKGAGAKFFEASLLRNSNQILIILAANTKIK